MTLRTFSLSARRDQPGKSSWQRRDNVNVINNTAYAHKCSTEIAADCGQICMYARPHVWFEPRLAVNAAPLALDRSFFVHQQRFARIRLAYTTSTAILEALCRN